MDSPTIASGHRISIWRFIAAELVLTLGVVLVIYNPLALGTPLGYPLMWLSGYCIPLPHSEALYRPLKWKDAIWIVAGLAGVALFLFILYAALRHVPEESLTRWTTHPAVLISLWILLTILNFRQWRKGSDPTPVQPEAA